MGFPSSIFLGRAPPSFVFRKRARFPAMRPSAGSSLACARADTHWDRRTALRGRVRFMKTPATAATARAHRTGQLALAAGRVRIRPAAHRVLRATHGPPVLRMIARVACRNSCVADTRRARTS